MQTPNDTAIRAALVREQIIVFGILSGLLVFIAYLLVNRFAVQGQGANQPQGANQLQAANQANEWPVLTLAAGGMLAYSCVMAATIPGLIVRNALRGIAQETQPRSNADATSQLSLVERLLATRQTALIVRLALLEGAGFLGCVAYLLSTGPHAPWALGIAGVSAALIAVNFPAEVGLRNWLDKQLEQLDRLRQEGDFDRRGKGN